jgi:hypothetical protein
LDWSLPVTAHADVAAPALQRDGWGGIRLGMMPEAALAAAGPGALAGQGCDGRDHVTLETRLGDQPVSVMAALEKGRIAEVELFLEAPTQTGGRAACLALLDGFAAPFRAAFGRPLGVEEPPGPTRDRVERLRPGANTLLELRSRYFPNGGTCYTTATYRPAP